MDEQTTIFAWRAYLNKREGNEHSRVIDVLADSADDARAKIEPMLEDDEVFDTSGITSISVTSEHELA